MIRIVDEIVPFTYFDGNVIKNNNPRLVKIKSINAIDLELEGKFASLNCEIRSHFFTRKNFQLERVFYQEIANHYGKQLRLQKVPAIPLYQVT